MKLGRLATSTKVLINDVVIISHLQQTGFTALSLGLHCML